MTAMQPDLWRWPWSRTAGGAVGNVGNLCDARAASDSGWMVQPCPWGSNPIAKRLGRAFLRPSRSPRISADGPRRTQGANAAIALSAGARRGTRWAPRRSSGRSNSSTSGGDNCSFASMRSHRSDAVGCGSGSGGVHVQVSNWNNDDRGAQTTQTPS